MNISLLITTFQRAVVLESTLRRLSHLTLPDELIVVDDGSRDHTRMIAENLCRDMGLPLQYIYRTKPPGIGYDVCSIPRNIGLKAARSEWLVVSEPEVLFITDVVAQFQQAVNEHPNHVVSAGSVYFLGPQTPVTTQIHHDPGSCLAHWDVKKHPQHPQDLFGPDGQRLSFTAATVKHATGWVAPFSAIYKREWLMAIGGWDEDMSLTRGGGGYGHDDTDLLTRLRIRGYNQVIDPNIRVIHQWHEPPPPNVGNGTLRNDQIFKSKRLDEVTDTNHPALIANKDREWGQLA